MPLPEIIKAELLKIDHDKKILICYSEDYHESSLIVRYGVSPENIEFSSSVEHFWKGAKLNIIDCSIDENGFLVPSYIILEPDYLIDASAIAECFQDYFTSSLHFFRNKFENVENRSFLLLGNLSNYFLDQLIFAEDIDKVSFNDIFLQSFKLYPFEYTSCEDIRSNADFILFMNNARQRFDNIKRVIKNDFTTLGIDVDHCTLEPSFFCVKYGFQGRLDLLYTQESSSVAKIIELKSGRLPYPSKDTNKIGLNHKVQTYIYRLMVESVFGGDKNYVDASILYAASNISGESIRKATLNGKLEKTILNLRNHIIINEHKIINDDITYIEEVFKSVCAQIKIGHRLPAFYINKIKNIENVLTHSNEIERAYLYRFIKFVSRELYHQKIGDIEYESPIGVASLWNSNFQERVDSLDMLLNLTIQNIEDSDDDMTIKFNRSNNNEVVNFREGDICIVYPRNDECDSVLNKQILKGTIDKISIDEVVVRFRYKQKNRHYFKNAPLWAIEHDSLDTTYNNMYKTLFDFISAPESKKSLLLGLIPGGTEDKNQKNQASRINNQEPKINEPEFYPDNIINKALEAEDYFLIVGPPGTGKTSIFVRRLIEEYHKQPTTNIMVIAYTNRAVDELCEAINNALSCNNEECDKYIRIGSELSCAPKNRHRLLKSISEKAINRESLRETIDKCRIWVSTLSSLLGKLEIFSLKEFHVSIIDEASQILEPQIIGLLPKFDKFIMIGDHNQLSTIVLQDKKHSTIKEAGLREIGITDCRDSLFERLLRKCIQMGWTHSFAQLTQQGRMHFDIAEFPAKNFYTEGLTPALQWQYSKWELNNFNGDNLLDKHVAKNRNIFLSTETINTPSLSNKINETEADVIVQLLRSIINVYEQNNKHINSGSIGIIAPYRNQVALIRNKIAKANIPNSDEIMIDTVERYQGSQRNIIIMSFCVNQEKQFKFLSNLNHDGSVDRKLNVALTRAREQLFLVGNARILQKHPVYARLLDFYEGRKVIL